jgi:hypothetical protein
MTMRRAMAGLVLGSMLLVFLACDDSPTDPASSPVGYQTVLKTSLRGDLPDLQGRETIRDQGTWQAVWTELYGGSPPPLPGVDFRREMVVAVVMGPSCGGEVTVSSIVREGAELVVNGQGRSCENTLCAWAEFSVHVVRLPRFDGPVRFNVKVNWGLC